MLLSSDTAVVYIRVYMHTNRQPQKNFSTGITWSKTIKNIFIIISINIMSILPIILHKFYNLIEINLNF